MCSRLISRDDDLLADAIQLGLLGIRSQGIVLITEGQDDKPFITAMAELFSISYSHVQFLPIGTQQRSLTATVTALRELCPQLRVRIIRDRDFCFLDPDERRREELAKITTSKGMFLPSTDSCLTNSTDVLLYYWELPVIESYLFLAWCKTQSNPFSFLNQPYYFEKKPVPAIEALAAKFFNCVSVTNPKSNLKSYSVALQHWADALTAMKDPSNENTPATVVKVLHGHTWTSIIQKSNLQLIREISAATMRAVYPSLETQLQTLLAPTQ